MFLLDGIKISSGFNLDYISSADAKLGHLCHLAEHLDDGFKMDNISHRTCKYVPHFADLCVNETWDLMRSIFLAVQFLQWADEAGDLIPCVASKQNLS